MLTNQAAGFHITQLLAAAPLLNMASAIDVVNDSATTMARAQSRNLQWPTWRLSPHTVCRRRP